MAQAQPTAGSSSGFKLVFKLGASAAPPAPPAPAPAPTPPPPLPQPPPVYHQPPAVTHAATSAPAVRQPVVQDPKPEDAGEAARRYESAMDKEARGVSSAKYRQLKRKYQEVVESRDDGALALFRAQKLIVRLREEKSSLLDRVLLLESAAGLTTDQVAAAQQAAFQTDRERDFPLLHPPSLPSLDDRPRTLPTLTTSTDLSHSSYNAPLGPPPAPLSYPPRLRSQHIVAAAAAQKLRDSSEARRVARGLPKAPFPAVAILGLEGSNIASLVERVLAGEHLQSVVETPAAAATGVASGKRRRESTTERATTGGGKGKGRASEPSTSMVVSLGGLPNPFAGAGAMPEGIPFGRPAVVMAGHDVEMDMGSQDSAMDDDAFDEGGTANRKHRAMPSGGPDSGEKTTKTRRIKAHGIQTGTFTVPFVHRIPDGSPVLPLALGVMVLKKLGAITNRPHYSTERYIFPIGFECTRRYPSMVDRAATIDYTCRITDGGPSPRFEIYPFDQPGQVISAGTATGAWSQVVKAANKIRQRNHSNSVSGPDYYGLAHNVVKALIQELPGARECSRSYIWQNFVEEPDPATLGPEEAKAIKKAIAGANKVNRVVGKKRKLSAAAAAATATTAPKTEGLDDDLSDDDDALMYESAYSGSPERQRSLSPVYAPPDPYANSASLANLVHQSNPYTLPPPVVTNPSPTQPAYPIFDPYALPAPQPILPSFQDPYAAPYLPPLPGGSPPVAAVVDPQFQPNLAARGPSWRPWEGGFQ